MYNLTARSVPHDKKTGREPCCRGDKEGFSLSLLCTDRAVFSQTGSLADRREELCCTALPSCVCLSLLFLPISSPFPPASPCSKYKALSSALSSAVAWPVRHFCPLFPFVYQFLPHFPDVCMCAFCIHLLGGLKSPL